MIDKRGKTVVVFPFFCIFNLKFLMKVSVKDLIGLKIKDIRFKYLCNNGYDLQEFTTYVKLTNDLIFTIPYYHDEEFSFFDEEIEEEYFNAQHLPKSSLKLFQGKEIVDFHFIFHENELCELEKAIVELGDELYFTEKHNGPMGSNDIDLQILNKQKFKRFKEEVESEEGFEVRSLKTINDK